MGLQEIFNEEILTVKKAPLTFSIGVVALGSILAWAEYTFIFKEWIAKKDSLIQTLEKQLDAVKAQSNQPASISKPAATGPASASGTGNIANSGPGAVINNGTFHTKNSKSAIHP